MYHYPGGLCCTVTQHQGLYAVPGALWQNGLLTMPHMKERLKNEQSLAFDCGGFRLLPESLLHGWHTSALLVWDP